MASMLESLLDEADSAANPPPVTESESLPGELPHETDTRVARLNRVKAEDLGSRGIPHYLNASGEVTPVTDDTGAALAGFDSKNKIAYDSAGEPKLISYGETGPPQLKDPFADLPTRTDEKTGDISQQGRGLYKWLGQDPVIAQRALQKEKDKAISEQATLLGRKLTLDEHDLVVGGKEHKALTEQLQEHVPALLNPKFHGADQATVLKAIDDHFNSQYAAPEANDTKGWFGDEVSPEALQVRKGIDTRKAAAYDVAKNLYATKERLTQLEGTVAQAREEERLRVETLLAHSKGEPGPLDEQPVATATGTAKGVEQVQKEWADVLTKSDDPIQSVHEQIQSGNVPAPVAPAVVAATHDYQDAQKKAEALKNSNPTLSEQFRNVAANIVNGITTGVGEISKGSLAEPGWSTLIDPLQQIGLVSSWAASLFSGKTAKQEREQARQSWTDLSKETAKLIDPRLKNTVGSKIGNFAGGMVPYVAAAIATKGKSVATPLLMSMFYTSGYQSTFEDAKSHGASDAQADGAGIAVGAINAVLALPLRTVGKAVEAVFGDTAPKIVERQIQNAYQAGGANGVYTILGEIARVIKGGVANPSAAKAEVGEALTKLMGELTKTAGQRALDVAKVAGQHAALGAGVQVSENLVKRTYNPEQGTFEGVPEQAIGFAALGTLSEGFRQVALARKAKQALDIINKRAGGGPAAEPPGAPAGLPPGGSAPEGPTPAAPEPPMKPADARVVEPTETKPAVPETKPATVETKPQAEVATLAEAEQAFVERGGHPDKLEAQQKLEALREKFPGPVDRLNAIRAHLDTTIDTAAHEAATSPKNNLREPTEAQKEAGNYQKGHEIVGGLDISVENPAGTRRQPEFAPLQSHYGYIKGTVGADKDHVDVFIKQGTPKDWSGPVFVVNQHDAAGKFDEHKAVIGVNTKAQAKAEYLGNYQKGWDGGKSVVKFDNPAAFKKWATNGLKGKPVTDYDARFASIVDDHPATTHIDRALAHPDTKAIFKAEGTAINYVDNLTGTSGLRYEPDSNALSIDRDQVAAHLKQLGEVKGHEWIQQAMFHEATHAADAGVARDAGQTLEQRYKKLVVHQDMLDAAGESYGEEFGSLPEWKQKAEAVRMVLEGRYSGRITEQIYKFIREILDRLKALVKKASPEFRKHIEAIQERINKAVGPERSVRPPIEPVTKTLTKNEARGVELTKRLESLKDVPATVATTIKSLLRSTSKTALDQAEARIAKLEPATEAQKRRTLSEVLPSTEAIDASYSGDKIPEGKVRKPVNINGKPWVATSGSSGPEGRIHKVTELIPADQFVGEKTTYRERVMNGDAARNDPRGFYYGVQVVYGGKKYILGTSIQIKGGETYADAPRQGPESRKPEHQGIPPRGNLPADEEEVREKDSGQTGDSGGAIERPAASAEKPARRTGGNAAPTSKLNPETQKQFKDALNGLFAGVPQLAPLNDMDRRALELLRKNRDKLGAQGRRQLKSLEAREIAQGDLLGHDDFRLAGETGTDWDAVKERMIQQESDRAESESRQGSLFAAKPKQEDRRSLKERAIVNELLKGRSIESVAKDYVVTPKQVEDAYDRHRTGLGAASPKTEEDAALKMFYGGAPTRVSTTSELKAQESDLGEDDDKMKVLSQPTYYLTAKGDTVNEVFGDFAPARDYMKTMAVGGEVLIRRSVGKPDKILSRTPPPTDRSRNDEEVAKYLSGGSLTGEPLRVALERGRAAELRWQKGEKSGRAKIASAAAEVSRQESPAEEENRVARLFFDKDYADLTAPELRQLHESRINELGAASPLASLLQTSSVQRGFEPEFKSESRSFPAKAKPLSFERADVPKTSEGPVEKLAAYDSDGNLVATFSVLASGANKGAFKITTRPEAERQGWAGKLMDEAVKRGMIDIASAIPRNRFTFQGRRFMAKWLTSRGLGAATPIIQKPIPADKLVPFVQLAQKFIEQGVDSPAALADEIKALRDERVYPFANALLGAMRLVKPELPSEYDWTPHFSAESERRRSVTRKPAPDGGFTAHPFVDAIINHGGLMSKSTALQKRGKTWFDDNAELWDGAPKLADPRHYKVYNPKTGLMPDEMAAALQIDGLVKDGYADEIWSELLKVSESSKRLEKAEREQAKEQARQEAAAGQEPEELEYDDTDPFGDLTALADPVPEMLMGTPVTQIETRVDENDMQYELYHEQSGKRAFIRVLDLDSGNVTTIVAYPNHEAARKEFELDIPAPESSSQVDDTGSGISLETDSGDATAGDRGGEDRVPTGRTDPGGNGQALDRPDGGPRDTATSGPLSGDVPSAPLGVGSDLLFPESASEPAKRPAGSTEPEGSARPGGNGVSPDTGRTVISGESLNGSSEPPGVEAGGDGRAAGDVTAEIAKSAPALQPEQVDDVRFIEARLLEQGKPGVLIANGTGTGKTFTSLGAIKRALDRGTKAILVVAPSDKIGSDWVSTAKAFFGINDIAQLKDTRDNGKSQRLSVTTYANFGQNSSLAERDWDMIVADESHYLSSAIGGADTLALDTLRALTWHHDGLYHRVAMLEPDATEGLRRLRHLERSLRRAKQSLSKEHVAERQAFQAAIDNREKEVRAKLEAMKEADKPKVIFMSATPFAYRENVQYGEGYLFSYPPRNESGAYNTPNPYQDFMIQNFGYRMRYGKLTQPENAAATGILERRFAERLMREKAMRGRALVVPFDYSRQFILTETQLGTKLDAILDAIYKNPRWSPLSEHIGVTDYLQRRFVLESLKAREAIPRIRKHIALGRKVVVFHDYKIGGALNPLQPGPTFDPSKMHTYSEKGSGPKHVTLGQAYQELRNSIPDWDKTEAELRGLLSPLRYFQQAFSPEELGIFNGDVPKKARRKIVADFNQSKGKMKVFLGQRASAQEGISLHDIVGDESRAFIDLGIPARPTNAIQSEGRIYRVGVQSNAIDEYLVTGTNFERWTFAQTIAQRASTAENLAMGEGARALLMAFTTGFNDAAVSEPHAEQGVGGKEADQVRQRMDPFEQAIALYYTNQKKTSRNKSSEGIDYYATPEPLGYKMIEWLMLQPGEKFLEPSAGHGALARFAPDSTTRHAVEPSNELAGRLALNAPDTEIHNEQFEDFNIVNKFDGIAMNPPFGTAGKTAMEHVAKAAKHLRDGGRLVAEMLRGKMDERIDKWLAQPEVGTLLQFAKSKLSQFNAEQLKTEAQAESFREQWKVEKAAQHGLKLRAVINLPPVLFTRAGTSVSARILILDRTEDDVETGTERTIQGDTIEEVFDRLQNLSAMSRPEKKATEPETAPTPVDKTSKAPSAGYSPDPEAIRQAMSPEHLKPEEWKHPLPNRDSILPLPTKQSDFTPASFLHTKTREPIYVAKTARYMSKPEFAAAKRRAQELGGYYSSFKGAGAVPGFHFKTAEARDAFISNTPESGLGAALPVKAVSAAYKDDLERIAKEIGLTAKESWVMFRKLVSPTTGVAGAAHDQVMKMLGTRYQKAYETDRVLEAARKMFDSMTRKDQIDFIDRLKQGTAQETPELQRVADTMRIIDTESWVQARNAYADLGFAKNDIPLAWLENHFRVLWKKIPGSDEEQKAWIGKARRGLRGSMGQHRQHTLDTMSEGLEMGGIPYSYNPVVMFKLAQADLWKLTTALRTWKWGKDHGFVQFVRGAFPKAPDGMVELDDAIAKVYFPAESGEGLVQAGKYFVEEGFGRLLNNYLSRDRIRATRIGRGLLWIKNATTSLELSLSVFHGIFETFEAIGSNIGLGLAQLINRGLLGGDMGAAAAGLKNLVTAIASPVTGYSLGREIRKAAADPAVYFASPDGQKMLKDYPRAREMIDDLFAGGWKPPELEQDWKNNSIRTFIDATADIKEGNSDNYIGAALRAFPAANEMLMKPLFDYFIPNLKVAQFFKEYAEALAQMEQKYGPNGYYIDRRGKRWDAPTRPELARKIWRFVEDRFGELNYDTLFWNSNFKTTMQLMFRSVTWKLGSVEAFAGAFAGQAKEFKDAFRERRAPELHRNMAWLFGLLLLTATMGAILSKVLAGKTPKSLADYVFPQIDPRDDKVRVSLPTYFKDPVHFIHSPKGYVVSSMSGWIGRVADLLRNKDYYGVQIRDTDDVITKQALDVSKYVGVNILPFSVRGYRNLSQQEVGMLRKTLAFVGVNPAPRYIGQSPAEKRAEEYWAGTQTEAGVKPEQFETRTVKRNLISKLRHGEDADIGPALESGSLKTSDVKPLYQRAAMGALASQVLHMPLPEAERIYTLASAQEKAQLEPIIAKKRANAATRGRRMWGGF